MVISFSRKIYYYLNSLWTFKILNQFWSSNRHYLCKKILIKIKFSLLTKIKTVNLQNEDHEISSQGSRILIITVKNNFTKYVKQNKS